ncbi:HlyD family efflux transporter periplasmic adaptor subunit [Noviherbaspirillum sp. ST9]|uniref:HlyD family efflux transporter periplasmic adaptor subunit n=1 Tax=Noviherbaspirillum sp. ST9 TaxID=3401606 RepID=UPI003B5896D6
MDVALPPLREELSLHPGPILANGEPSHILEDPVRNQFFRIDWMTFEILQRWSFGNPEDIALSVRSSTTLHPDADDVAGVLKFLADNQLVRPDPTSSVKPMARRHIESRGSLSKQLLHHYLFFRIPLLKPDRWLAHIAPAFDWMFSKTFARLTLLALVLGGAQVFREWERFTTTLADTFTPSGLLAYAIAMAGVKCAHELGHALTAKRYGCQVPSMGLAFLVLWPVPYTDTNAVWRLRDNRKRLHVAGAGVATELVIAVWSTLAWTLLPDGLLRSIVFPLATTTWIATLAINLSPFMRFDGYFLLSDWLDMPNLHNRAFDLARWDLRERLFALGAQPPEHFTRLRHAGLILFAWGTWLYRLSLFLAIALLVYHFFIKAVGIFLFAVEIVWFILRPITNEIGTWRALWPQLRHSKRARRSAGVLAILVLLFVIPWPSRIQAGGSLHALQVFPVHAPVHAQVVATPVTEGSEVKAGQVLIALGAMENDKRRQALESRIERLRWQVSSVAAFDSEQRARMATSREELETAEAEWRELQLEAARFQPVAPFDGRLHDVEPDLAPGVWVRKNERLALLVGKDGSEAETFLDEESVQRVSVGDSARFYPDGLDGPARRLVVTGIDQDATRVLPSGWWAAQHGGSVAAREKQGAWYPEHGVYRVKLALAPDEAVEPAHQALRGTVVIAGKWEAPGLRFVRNFFSVLWRELGF